MKRLFAFLSAIRIVVVAFFGIGLVFNAYAANIALDSELQFHADDGYITLHQNSVNYNTSTGVDIADSSSYVTIGTESGVETPYLFWCWTTSTPTNYFDSEQCSPYDVGIVIPSGKTVNTITLRINRQAGTYQWLRFTYSGNGATGGTPPTWPIYCTSKSTVCKLPENKYTKSGYKFVGWDIGALNSTMTVSRLPGASLEGLISGNKTVTIKAVWELDAIKAQVTIDMGESGLSAMAYNDVCTSARCMTPSAMGTNMPQWYGHEFLGWKVLANGVAVNDEIYGQYTYTDVHEFVTAEDMTITFVAQWKPYTYYIKYACSAEDATNGNYVYEETSEFGANFTVISKETSDGYCKQQNYDIARWKYNDIDGEPVFNFGETYEIDILATKYTYELVPEYKPKTYYITYDCGGDGTMLSGYSKTQEVTFSQSYTTAGKICTKDGYYQTGWQTPNAVDANNPYVFGINQQKTYTFSSGRTYTAVYEPVKTYTITYECGDGKMVAGTTNTQSVQTDETYMLTPKICYKESYRHTGWKVKSGTKTFQFYTQYTWDGTSDITLEPVWGTDYAVDCTIRFTSDKAVSSKPADFSVLTGSTLTNLTPSYPPLIGGGYKFDGWTFYDDKHDIYIKYYDYEGRPLRTLDYDHCPGTEMVLQAQWTASDCTEKKIYNGLLPNLFDSTPIKTVYVADGKIYSDNRCEKPVAITANNVTTNPPANATYSGVWGYHEHPDVQDIICINTSGTANNYDVCKKEERQWYAKYTCNDGYENLNGVCTHATKVFFEGNGGTDGASYSYKTFYYGQPVPSDIPSNGLLPSRTGYVFMGWYDKPDYTTATQYYDNQEKPVTNGGVVKQWDKTDANSTLYAGWKPARYQVKYVCAPGSLSDTNLEFEPATYDANYTVAGAGRCQYANHIVGYWNAKKSGTDEIVATHTPSSKITPWTYASNMEFYPVYTKETTISFDLNGGYGGNLYNVKIKAIKGQELKNLSSYEQPERDGYDFTGWYDIAGKKYYNADGAPVISSWDKDDTNTTLYAGWSGETYTVTFDCGYGQIMGDESAPATLGQPFTMPAPDRCLRRDWTLYAWEIQLPDGTRYEYGASETIPKWEHVGDMTFTAMYNPGQIIIFDLNGGTAPETGGQVQPVPAAKGEPMPGINHIPPIRKGYQFMGWYDGLDYKNSKQYYTANAQPTITLWDQSAQSFTLYAGWEPKVYKAIYVCAPGTNNGTETEDVIFDTNYKLAGANRCSYAGHVTSGGWDARISATNPTIIKTYGFGDTISPWNYDSDIEFVAKYTPQTTIYFDTNGGTPGDMGASDYVIATRGAALPEIGTNPPTRSGYQFMGWYNGTDYKNSVQYYTADGQPAKSTWNIEDATITLYAGWEQTQFEVKYNCGTGASYVGWTADDVQHANKGQDFTVKGEICSKSGYKLSKWKGYINGQPIDFELNQTFVYNYTTGMTLEAVWTTPDPIQCTIKFNAQTGQTSQSDIVKTTGTVLPASVAVATKDGYNFTGWYYRLVTGAKVRYYDNNGNRTSNVSTLEYANCESGTMTLYADYEAMCIRTNVYNGMNPGNFASGNVVASLYRNVNGYYSDADCYNQITEFSVPLQENTISYEIVSRTDGQLCVNPENDKFYAINDSCNTDYWIANYVCSSGMTVYNGKCEKSIRIEFDLNGGTSGPDGYVIETVAGQPLEKLNFTGELTPRRTGYQFKGWYNGTNYKTSTQYYDASGNPLVSKFDNSIKLYAGWESASVVIVIDPNGGSGGTTQINATYDAELPKIVPPTRAGYSLLGLYSDPEDVVNDIMPYYYADGTPARNLDTQLEVLYAVWTPNVYTVTYDCGSGAIGTPPQSTTVTYDRTFTASGNIGCSKSDMIFSGWVVLGDKSDNVITAADDIIWNYAEDKTLVAKWVQGEYSVNISYLPGEGAMGSAPTEPITCKNTEACILPNPINYINPGYKFSFWKHDDNLYSAGENISKMITSALNGTTLTFTAQWVPDSYTLTYRCGDDAFGMAPSEQSVMYLSNFVPFGNITCSKPMYDFAGWVLDGQELIPGQTYRWGYTENKTVIPKWKDKTVKITIIYDAGTNVTGVTGNNGVKQICTSEDDICTLGCISNEKCSENTSNVFSRVGYTLMGWSLNDSCQKLYNEYIDYPVMDIKDYINACDSENIHNVITATAVWQPNTYTATFDCDDDIGLVDTINDIQYDSVTVLPSGANCRKIGYTFDGWKLSDTDAIYDSNAKIKWQYTGDNITFVAQWKPNVYSIKNITYDANGATGGYTPGAITCTSDKCVMPENTFVRSGYDFVGWKLSGLSGGDINVNPNQDIADKITETDHNQTITLTAQWKSLCNSIVINAVYNGGIVDERDFITVYRKTGETAMFSDDKCLVSLESIVEPIKTNATFTGVYNQIGQDGGVQCVDASGKFVQTENCNVNQNSIWYARFDCNSNYTMNGINIRGECSPNAFNVSYNCGEGTGNAPATARARYNSVFIPSQNTCVKDGYVFTGWKISDTETVVQPNKNMVWEYNTGKNLIAQWTQKVYSVTLNYLHNGATGGTAPANPINCTSVSECVLPENKFTRNGYEFIGWMVNDGNIFAPGTNIQEQITEDKDGKTLSISARWLRNTYTLSYDMNGGMGVMNLLPNVCMLNAECELIAGPNIGNRMNRTGYVFGGWSNSPDSMTPVTFPNGIMRDTTVYAIWTPCDTGSYKTAEMEAAEECLPCNRDYATEYETTGICMVKSCDEGYHPQKDMCEPDVIDCEISNAAVAQMTWDSISKSYGACTVMECQDSYHIENNECLPDVKDCTTDHGYGYQEWDTVTQAWSGCIIEKCSPGYTNDPSLTDDENWEQCGRCNNYYAESGEVAVSSYIQECEIASCMHQGELYMLSDNQCVLICIDEKDETGRRWWDGTRCQHKCNPGYLEW